MTCPTWCRPDCREPCHEVHVPRWRRTHPVGSCRPDPDVTPLAEVVDKALGL